MITDFFSNHPLIVYPLALAGAILFVLLLDIITDVLAVILTGVAIVCIHTLFKIFKCHPFDDKES